MPPKKQSISLNSPQPFEYSDESKHTAGTRWAKWIRDFDLYLKATDLECPEQRMAVLLHVAGEAVRDIYYTKAEETDKYDEVCEKLNKHFNPMKHIDFNIYQFGQMIQGDNESMDDFVVRLRKAAALCEFANVDSEIKRQIIRACKSKRLTERILEKPTITLAEIMELSRTTEAVQAQASSIQDGCTKSESIAMVRNKSNFRQKSDSVGNGSSFNNVKSRNEHVNTNSGNFNSFRHKREVSKPMFQSRNKCFNCGNDFPHPNKCPAADKKCNRCKKTGHFGKCCNEKKLSVRTLTRGEEKSESEEERRYLFAQTGKDKGPTTMVKIDKTRVAVLIDSGAHDDVIDQDTYEK